MDVEPGEEPGLPRQPLRLGTPTPRYNLGAGHTFGLNDLPLDPVYGTDPGYTVEDTGSVDIHFDNFDLRPEDRIELPTVPLLVDASAGTLLACEWTATAGNVPGRLSGRFTLNVAASTLSLNDLDHDEDES